MSITSKPLSKYKIGDNISSYKKLVAKFDFYVLESNGKIVGRMNIQRDSKHLTHDEIIKVLQDQIKIQLKLKEGYEADLLCSRQASEK